MTREDFKRRAEISIAVKPEYAQLMRETITAQKAQTTADITLEPSVDLRALSELMIQAFGEGNVTIEERDRKQHGRTMSGGHLAVPDVIVYPSTIDQIQWLSIFASSNKIPLVPYGQGTSFESNCSRAGITINLSRMCKILHFYSEDREIRVQAGASQQDVNDYLRDSGCYFPMDNECAASVGGMIATNAASAGQWRMCDLVRSVAVVLADGSLVRTHPSRAKLSSTGPDLTSLFIGSEGCLGIIVEATLGLLPVPKSITVGICTFSSLAEAIDASTTITSKQQHNLHRCQLVSPTMIESLNVFHNIDFPVLPTLFMEAHGVSRGGSDFVIEACKDLCRERGMQDFIQYADTDDAPEPKLWAARSTFWLSLLQKGSEKGEELMLVDVAVPASRFKEALVHCLDEASRCGLGPLGAMCNNLLGSIILATKISIHNHKHLQQFQQFKDAVSRKIVQSYEGSCGATFGFGKRPDLLSLELGASEMKLLGSLKHELDPHGIMNPDIKFLHYK